MDLITEVLFYALINSQKNGWVAVALISDEQLEEWIGDATTPEVAIDRVRTESFLHRRLYASINDPNGKWDYLL